MGFDTAVENVTNSEAYMALTTDQNPYLVSWSDNKTYESVIVLMH